MQPFLQQFSRRYPLFAAIFSSISFCSHSCINNRLLQQPFLYAAISAVVFPQHPQPFLYAAIFAAVFSQISFVRSNFQQHLFLQPFLHQQPSSAAAIFVCSHFRSSFSAAIFYMQPFLQQFSRRYPLFAAIFSSISFCSHSCINNRVFCSSHFCMQPFPQ